MYWPPFPNWVPASLLGLLVLEWWITQRRLRELPELPEVDEAAELPGVCVCIPARDEAMEIGPALDSWLAQDYPGLAILVVDDGSTDGTPGLLAERQARHPRRLRVLRQDTLPGGWLGKNHALHLATSQPEAKAADWLLFVDADVSAHPRLLRRAVAHALASGADILTLIAAVDTVSVAERIFIPPAMVHFLWFMPPKRVADPHSGFFCGTGGFTIVRRKAYEAIGGHAAAPHEAIDDMRLAQRMKQAGFANHVARGGPELHLRMYHGLSEILRGSRKNILGVAHLWALAPAAILVLITLSLSPLWLALGHWPLAGFTLWVVWPALVGEVNYRLSAKPMDWIWSLWPLAGLIAAVGMAWAFVDRVRGFTRWRGRKVSLRTS